VSKFNKPAVRPAVGQSPIATEAMPSGRTYEGAPGYARGAKGELFLLAVSNMVGEQTFYEASGDRDARYAEMVQRVAVDDPAWVTDFLRWLRVEGNMRSASLVGAAEAVAGRLAAGTNGGSRQMVNSVLQRPDEPGELFAYWVSRYGRVIPKPVKRGAADAVRRLYNQYALLKYDTGSHGFRFADVIDLVHPTPGAPWQSDLFRYALDRRHGRDVTAPWPLGMLHTNRELRALAVEHPEALLNPEVLRSAGMTWEDALSLVGSKVDKRKLWEALIPSMGYMALLRNLRNFDQAGVSDEVAEQVAKRISDPEQVARSRQFPFRFLSAYRNVPSLRWEYPLEKALDACLVNVPELSGRTLILVDRSGSMFWRRSEKAQLTWADSAAIFGAALAKRNHGRADLVEFGSTSQVVPLGPGDSLLRLIERFHDLGGTYIQRATREHYRGHDRVVIITDDQAHDGDPGAVIPPGVPLYLFNLIGYRHGSAAAGPNRVMLGGGLTDAAFRLIPLLEAGRSGVWPWQVD
jgi:hypothetical protein